MADANIDEVWNVLGFGRLQYILFFSCSAQQLYVAIEQLGLGIITVASSCELNIDQHRMAWLLTAVFLGQVGTSHYMGYMSDSIGRRKLLLITSMMTMLMSLLSSLMPEYWSFLTMRFFVSCFLSGPGMTVLTYLSEFTKVKLRPNVTNFLSYSVALGMIYVPLMAMWLFPLKINLHIVGNYSITSWRVLMMVDLLPGIISWIMIYTLPESPKYYLSTDQPLKAMEVLEICCRYNKGNDVTLRSLGYGSVSQPRIRHDFTPQHKFLLVRMWYETKPLFQGVYLRHMLLVIFILFPLFGTGFGLSVWMPRVLQMVSEVSEPMVLCDLINAAPAVNRTDNTARCVVSTQNLFFIIFGGCCCLCLFMLISVLLIWINRKIILLAFALLATVSGFLLNFVTINFLLVTFFVFLTASPFCSLRLVLTVLIDVIPTHLRNKAIALSMMFGRVGVLSSNLFFGYTLTRNCLITFNVFVGMMLTAFILISCLPSESDVINIANT